MVALSGGARLEAFLRALAAKVSAPATLRVGFLEGSTEADGTSLPTVAAVNEFGAPSRGQPPRPFFRNMIAKHKGEWGDETAAALKANGMDATKALDLMGQRIAGELAQSILDTNDPPLKPATIKRKGFAKPLVDTRTMLHTAQTGYEVVGG